MELKLPLALEHYNKAISLDPTNVSAFFFRGEIHYEQKDYQLAIKSFSEVIKLRPNSARAYSMRASAYAKLRNDGLAVADYSKVISLQPTSNAFVDRAQQYSFMGLYEQAIKDFQSSIRLEPERTYTNFQIIYPLIRTGKFSAAKEHYETYKVNAEKEKSYIDNRFSLYVSAATIDIPSQAYEEALVKLENILNAQEFLKKDTRNNYTADYDFNVLSLKGYILEKLNRLEEAKDVYSQSLLINSNQPDIKLALTTITKKENVLAQSDKIPPEIEIISPQTSRGLNIISAKEDVQIVGRAKDASGVAIIKVNGKAVDVEKDGLFITTLPLKAGMNEILVSAADKQGNSSIKTFKISGTIARSEDPEIILPVKADAMPNYFAILIAEKDYIDPSIPDLQNPIKDAKELKSILERQYTFHSSNIDTLYNKSREEIMQVIIQRSNRLTENDNLVIFYAGHGIAEKDQFGDVDGYWIPSSAKKGQTSTYISASDINTALKRSKAKHVLVIADACFSGAFTRALPGASIGIQKQFEAASRKVMASGNLEPVPDNSKFLYYLKKTLESNKDKYISAKKVFDSFYDAIINNSDNLPQYAAIKNVGDEGGEFVFIKR